jgi:nitrate/nitrite transport system ATP-binding protein
MPILEMKRVCKSYGHGARTTSVLKDVSLTIEEGEFVALVGFSGSGKTTLVSTLAGLIKPDSGEVLFKGEPVTGAAPERAVVFQSYSLLPWLSVTGNVALAVDAVHGGLPAAERTALVAR